MQKLRNTIRPSKTPHTSTPSPGNAPGRFSLQRLGAGRFGEIFGIDLRSLAVFRIGLGLVVLMDVLQRSTSLKAHYTDAGVLPRGTVISTLNEWRWSVLFANGGLTFQALMFLLTATAAILLMVGFRSRLMTCILWVMVISIQVRNPLLSSGADTLMRLLLFWSMLLPLGARWSIDSAWAHSRTLVKPVRAFSLGSAGLLLQIALMYWFTALLKTGTPWWSEGTALYYALGAGQVTRPTSEFLLQFPILLRILTHATMVLEYVAPALLFLPFLFGPVRTLATASLMAFHVGILLTMDFGVFSWAGVISMACYLPAWFWDVLLPKLRKTLPERFGVFRRQITNALKPVTQAFPTGYLSRSLQSGHLPSVTGADHDDPASSREHSTSGTTFRAGWQDGGVLTGSRLGNLLAAFCIVFVLAWNISTVSAFTVPREYQPVAYGMALYQRWSMFAPKPPSATQWYVVRGELVDGQEVDLLAPLVRGDINQVVFLSWDRPDDIVNGHYGDKSWRKYIEAIGRTGRSAERMRFAAYVCRTWNDSYAGDVALDRVEIYRLTQRTMLDGSKAEIKRTLVDDFSCAR